MRKLFITISKTILFFVGWAVLVGFTPDIPTDNPAILRLGWEFTPLLTIIVFTLVFVFVLEKRNIKVPIFNEFFYRNCNRIFMVR